MTDFWMKIFRLSLTADEQKVLDALNASEITSRRVIGRGTLTMDVAEVTRTAKFKKYSQQTSQIVANHTQT